jgi:hypothetical protein
MKMKKTKIIILMILITIIPTIGSYAETLKSLDFHGRWPDASQRAAAVDATRGLLFLADGNVITVLNTSNLAVVSKLALELSTGIRGIVINAENSYLYAACGKDGLKVIDISDARNSFVSASLAAATANDEIFASGIAILSNRVFIADVYYGLRIINVNDPGNPMLEASYEQVNVSSDGKIFSGGHENLAVEKINDITYVFILDKYRGLRVFESDGDTITHLVNYPSSTTPTSLYSTKPVTDVVIIDKKYAVISDYENGLVFVDLFSDLEKLDTIMITTIINFETPGSSSSMSVAGDALYVADGNSGLQIVDITDLSTPSIVGNFNTAGAHSVIAQNQIAFLSDSSKGLQRISCSDESNPVATHTFDSPSDTDALFVKDGLIYSLDDDAAGEGLRIIAYSSDNDYEMNGFCQTPGTALATYVYGNFAYVADGNAGLTIINVSDPESPLVETSINGNGTANQAIDIYVAAGFAYLTDAANGLLVFDVANPRNPILADSFNPGNNIQSIHVRNSYAYTANDAGIDVIDISDPSNMKIVGSWGSDGNPSDIFLDNKYGYLSDGAEGLKLINVSRPEQLVVIDSYETAGQCNAVDVYSVFAHCAVGEAGLEVIGVVDSQPPRLSYVTIVDTPGYAADIFVDGDDTSRFTYVADSSGGLLAFKHNDQYAGGIDEKPFTSSKHDRGWDRHEGMCFISTLY